MYSLFHGYNMSVILEGTVPLPKQSIGGAAAPPAPSPPPSYSPETRLLEFERNFERLVLRLHTRVGMVSHTSLLPGLNPSHAGFY